MDKTKQLIVDFIEMYGEQLLNNKGNNLLIDNLVERLKVQSKPIKKGKVIVAVCKHEWIYVNSGYNMNCKLCGKRAE